MSVTNDCLHMRHSVISYIEDKFYHITFPYLFKKDNVLKFYNLHDVLQIVLKHKTCLREANDTQKTLKLIKKTYNAMAE